MRQAFALVLAAIGGVLGAPATSSLGGVTSISPKRELTSRVWAGAVKEGPKGTGWNFVQGSVVVPSISGQSPDASAAIWVGIDGYDCGTAIIQTGIIVYGDGTLSTWTEWWQYSMIDYSTKLPFAAGDTLRFTAHASSTTSGTTTIENLSNGESVSHTFSGETAYPLCQTDAEWIVEDWQWNKTPVPLVDWGTVKIFNTIARGANGQVTAAGSEPVEIKIDNSIVTSTSMSSSGDVSVTYTG